MSSVTLSCEIRAGDVVRTHRRSRLGRTLRKTFRAIHGAIAAAKLRRLRNELLLRRGAIARIESGMSRRPQVPLLLCEKWDF